MAFVGLTKPFDIISRYGLWTILAHLAHPLSIPQRSQPARSAGSGYAQWVRLHSHLQQREGGLREAE